jgi:aryl-alcohol dehydrogenase-like predicted oxidoreductase
MQSQCPLGKSGLEVSSIGLGVMGMSEFYGAPDERENEATLERSLELGVNFWDTADAYGSGHNERMIGRFLAERRARERVVLATKFGFLRDDAGRMLGVRGDPAYVASACDASLARLGVECIDLYYLHRVDPRVPVEETVGAMAALVKAGKVRALGLSEVSPATLRRAGAVHPIAAVQSEYSLWSRDPERPEGILTACREQGAAFVAYSPLGRGFLTGRIASLDELGADDFRRRTPRFERENFERNLRLVERLREIAAEKGCAPGQLALAWLLARSPHVIPIPGTKRRKYLEENAGAAALRLDAQDLARIDAALPPGAAAGERYDAGGMSLTDR